MALCLITKMFENIFAESHVKSIYIKLQ